MNLAPLKLHAAVAVTLLSIHSANAGVPITPGLGSPVNVDGFRNPYIENKPGVGVNNAGFSIGNADRVEGNQPKGDRAGRTTFGGFTFLLNGLDSFNAVGDTDIYAINNAGVIVGSSAKPNSKGTRATRYESINTLDPTELGHLGLSSTGTTESGALAVNEAGTTVGYATTFTNGESIGIAAVRWNAGSTVANKLNPLASQVSAESYAIAINNAGTVIGLSSARSDVGPVLGLRAVRWAPNSSTAIELQPLQVTENRGYAVPMAINSAGVVVGSSNVLGFNNLTSELAVRWNANSNAPIFLHNLGSDSNGESSSRALDINTAGTVAGCSEKYSATETFLGERAVRWGANQTTPTELGVLFTHADGTADAYANGINDRGTIIGAAAVSNGNEHATMWLANSTAAVDLNTLVTTPGWTLVEARSVSDTGFITGEGLFDPDGTGSQQPFERTWSILAPQAGTYGLGDGNFDTKTNFDDLVLLAQRYNKTNALLAINVADFNLDGKTDFADLVALAQNYSNTSNLAGLSGFDASFQADWAMAQSLVPEPSMLMGMSSLLLLRRKSLTK